MGELVGLTQTDDLVRELFGRPEKWGWQYVSPRPVRPFPGDPLRPTWREPMAPDYDALWWERGRRLRGLWIWPILSVPFALAAWVALTISTEFLSLLTLLPPALILALGVVKGLEIRSMVSAAHREHIDLCRAGHARYLDDLARFERDRARHLAGERNRYSSTPDQFPIAPSRDVKRVDVFGGTYAGWSALLATFGCSVIGSDESLLVIDLTGEGVAVGLANLCRHSGAPVQWATLPSDQEWTAILDPLSSEELANVLAEAMSNVRMESDAADLRTLDLKILRTIMQSIERPWTFRRIAAALDVLRSMSDPDADSPLQHDEVLTLHGWVDRLGTGEKFQAELDFLHTHSQTLSGTEPDAKTSDVFEPWSSPGLTVLQVSAETTNTREVAGSALFQVVAGCLGSSRSAPSARTVVVLGVDGFGRRSIDSLIRKARQSNVRLVLAFENLRDEATHLVGTGGSATLFMRLGNAAEAETAADFIGRDYRFVLSQTNRQHGESADSGWSDSRSTQHGQSENVGTGGSVSKSENGPMMRRFFRWRQGANESWGESLTSSWSSGKATSFTEGHDQSQNGSKGTSLTMGEVQARSHEYRVEKTVIQTLPETYFLLVEVGPFGRRWGTGDCFPGIALDPRRSPHYLEASRERALR